MDGAKLTDMIRHGDPRLEDYKARAWAWLHIVRKDRLAGRLPHDEPYLLSLRSIARLTPPIKAASISFSLRDEAS